MLSSNLKKLRTSLCLTPAEVGEGMGLTRQTIYRIEDGTAKKSNTLFYELYLKDIKRKREYAAEHRKEDYHV